MSMATILKSCSLDSDASARGFVPEEIDLGDDVLAEIILRLPLDSVARSRCVSKNWCAAIADGYLRRRLRLHMSMICFPDNDDALGGGGGGSRPVYACAGEGRRLEVRDLGFFPLHDSVIFCDGCNGLLLCRTPGAPEFYVVSPLIRSWAALPRPAKEARLSVLAFDPLGGSPQHYHVINFTGWRDRGAAVEVFSSETRAWAARDVDFGGVPAGSLSGSVHCHGGAVYFLACDPDCIVRMDLAAGAGLACTVIDLPEARAGGRRRPRRALRRPAALLLQPRRAAQSLVARGRPPAPAVAPEARSESRRRRGGRRRRGEVPGDAPGESGGGLHMVAVEGRRVRPGQARDHRRGVGVRQGREEPCRQRRGLSRPRATFQIALRTMVWYWRAELIRDGYVAVRSEPCLTHRTEME